MTKLLEQIYNSEKKPYKLEELFKVGPQYGFTESANVKKMGPRFLRITDIQGNIVDWKTVPYCKISDLEKQKYLLQKNDLVFARTGATTGMSYFVDSDLPEDAVFASYLIRLRFDEKICSPRLLKYFFQSRKYWGQVNGSLSGSAQPGINAVTLSQMEVDLSNNLSIQNKIADILGKYDEKIENNNKIIKNLEATAQTIFDEWFIKFRFPGYEKVKMVNSEMGEIPEGWKIKKLDEISDIIFGFNFKAKVFNEEKIGAPVVRIRDVLDGITKTYSTEIPAEEYKINSGDLLIGMDGTFHCAFWYTDGAFLNQRVSRIRSDFPGYFIYESIRLQLDFLQKTITGATVGHLSNGDIRNFKILIPKNTSILKVFKNVTCKILDFKKENKNLKETRDLLLEKLI